MKLVPLLTSILLCQGIGHLCRAQEAKPEAVKPAEKPAPGKVTPDDQLRQVLRDALAAIQALDKEAETKTRGELGLASFEWRTLQEPKASALAAIGTAQAKVGDKEAARKTWQDAIDAASSSPAYQGPDFKVDLLRRVGEAQAGEGDRDDALATLLQAAQAARSISDGQHLAVLLGSKDAAARKATALCLIAKAQATAGDARASSKTFTQAVESAHAIKNVLDRIGALVEIAHAEGTDAGQALWDEAIQFALALPDEYQKAQAVGTVLQSLVRAGVPEKAFALIADRLKGDLKAYVIAVISYGLLDEEKPVSPKVLAALSDLAYKAEFDLTSKRLVVFKAIAELQAKAGNGDGAIKTIDSVQPGKDAHQGHLLWVKLEVMREVARAQLKAGLKDAAKDTLQAVVETLAPFQHNEDSTFSLTEIAALLVRAGDPQTAVQIARNDWSSSRRVDALTAVAVAQAEQGARDDARRTLELALSAIDGIANEQLWSMMSDQFRGLNKQLRSTLLRGFSLHPTQKNAALKSIAIAWAKAGDLPRALETARSIPTDEEFGGRTESMGAFSGIAIHQAKSGDFAGALKTIDAIADNPSFRAAQKTDALNQIAREQVKAGDSRGVVEWAGKRSAPKVRLALLQTLAEGISGLKGAAIKPAPSDEDDL